MPVIPLESSSSLICVISRIVFIAHKLFTLKWGRGGGEGLVRGAKGDFFPPFKSSFSSEISGGYKYYGVGC